MRGPFGFSCRSGTSRNPHFTRSGAEATGWQADSWNSGAGAALVAVVLEAVVVAASCSLLGVGIDASIASVAGTGDVASSVVVAGARPEVDSLDVPLPEQPANSASDTRYLLARFIRLTLPGPPS
jgi:hypothetical protein